MRVDSVVCKLAGLPEKTKLVGVWPFSTTPDGSAAGKPRVPALAVSVTVMEALSGSWTVKPDNTVDTPTLAAYCVGTVALGGAAATLRLMVLGVSRVRSSLSLTATVTLAVVRPDKAVKYI